MMVGVWKPLNGLVRLDGVNIYNWDRDSIGEHVGYLPQDVELFSGTVRANIARFHPAISDADVIRAATLAGAHDLIVQLPKGYDTELGEAAASCRPVRGSWSAWPAPLSGRPPWWCWTNPMPASTTPAKWLWPGPSSGFGSAASPW
nr:hypothetical protein [Caulobacter sp. B11]